MKAPGIPPMTEERRQRALLGLCPVLAGCMGAYCLLFPPPVTDASPGWGDTVFLALFFAALYGGGLVYLALRCGGRDVPDFLFPAAMLAALLGARQALFGAVSIDMSSALLPWCEELAGMPFRQAVGASVGNYNVPYLYMLAILTRLPIQPLYGIKAFSVLFDLLLAIGVAECAVLAAGKEIRTPAFLLTLAVPTVLINGAWWGQCDGVYAALCVLSLWFALRGRGRGVVILFATAFAFKLQAVFFLPVIVGCILLRRIRLRELAWFPAVLAAWCLPAALCGRGVRELLSIYLEQAGGYTRITLNAPNAYQFLGESAIWNETLFPSLDRMAILLAGCGAVWILYAFWRWRDRLDTRTLIALCYLSAAVLPYLLPRMHERYFFLADMLAVLLFLCWRELWYVPVLTVGGSFLASAPFLFRAEGVDYRYGSLAILAAIGLTAGKLLRTQSCSRSGKEREVEKK